MKPSSSTITVALPAELTDGSYASLRTFRRNGTGVDCPVWFAWSDDGATIWFRSKADTAKIRRLVADPTIEMRPCNWRGVVRGGAVIVRGTARRLDDAEPAAAIGEQLLSRRYGWQWYTTPLFRIPFTHTSKLDLSFREKLRLIRSRQRHPGSCLVEVAVSPS